MWTRQSITISTLLFTLFVISIMLLASCSGADINIDPAWTSLHNTGVMYTPININGMPCIIVDGVGESVAVTCDWSQYNPGE